MEQPQNRNESAGIAYAAGAYALWGIFPLFWRLLDGIPPFQLAVHRIFWCAIFVGLITLWRGHMARLWRVCRSTKLVQILFVSSLLIAVNWGTYIYAIATRQVVQASLGYFINPLLSILLGVLLLGEKLSRIRLAAVVLAGVAVTVKAVAFGHIPLIALGLAVTFGLYGYVRKTIPIDALDGLFIETALLLPFTMLLIAYWSAVGTDAFPAPAMLTNGLMVVAGPVTALPLVLFAAGAKRIRLSTLGFVQYLSPILTLGIAVFLFGETFTAIDAAVFGCIWLALILVAGEGQLKRLGRKTP